MLGAVRSVTDCSVFIGMQWNILKTSKFFDYDGKISSGKREITDAFESIMLGAGIPVGCLPTTFTSIPFAINTPAMIEPKPTTKRAENLAAMDMSLKIIDGLYDYF